VSQNQKFLEVGVRNIGKSESDLLPPTPQPCWKRSEVWKHVLVNAGIDSLVKCKCCTVYCVVVKEKTSTMQIEGVSRLARYSESPDYYDKLVETSLLNYPRKRDLAKIGNDIYQRLSA